MTWDEICRNADGAIFGEHTLKAKDNAREDEDCPEDEIEMHCNEMNVEFDADGRIVNIGL